MLKNILKLKGVEELKKEDQKNLNGGNWGRRCRAILCAGDDGGDGGCGDGCRCVGYICQS